MTGEAETGQDPLANLEALWRALEAEEAEAAGMVLGGTVADGVQRLLGPGDLDLEAAAAYLLLGARLLDRKVKALVPAEAQAGPEPAPAPDQPEDLEDAAQELTSRLLAYRGFRDAADLLRAYEEAQALRFPGAGLEPPQAPPGPGQVSLEQLLEAFRRIWERATPEEPREIPREELSVYQRCEELLTHLAAAGGPVPFSTLFAGQATRRQVVVTFLALLELVRQARLDLQQEDSFGEIHIRFRPGDAR